MRREPDDRLYERYPFIFHCEECVCDTALARSSTRCGNGWFHLIDAFCRRVDDLIYHSRAPHVVIKHVEERSGSLRIYCNGENDLIVGMAMMVEDMSSRICEICGRPGKVEARRSRHHGSLLYQARCLEHLANPP